VLEFEIRRAIATDAVGIAALSGELGYPITKMEAGDRLELVNRSTEHEVQVAVLPDGSLVGWIHVFVSLRLEAAPFAELGGFIVAANYRAQGIGKRLLISAQNWAVQKGLDKLRIRSRSTRIDAHRFYKKFGFSHSKTQHVFDMPL